MRQLVGTGLLVLSSLLYLSPALQARMIAPQPILTRVAKSDIVLIGKVTDIEKDPVKTKDNGEFQIATVKIEDGLLGTKGLTHVKVGSLAGSGRGRAPALHLGQEVCLFLQKYPGENFYTAPMYFDIITKAENPNFAKEAAEAKKYATLLTRADENLKSKDAQTRYETAALLILYHRTARPNNEKQKELDAALSKQILEALRDAEWKPNPSQPAALQPLQIFYRLQLTREDGWGPQGGDIPTAARKWLEDNAGKYRIKSYIAEQK